MEDEIFKLIDWHLQGMPVLKRNVAKKISVMVDTPSILRGFLQWYDPERTAEEIELTVEGYMEDVNKTKTYDSIQELLEEYTHHAVFWVCNKEEGDVSRVARDFLSTNKLNSKKS